MLDRDLLAALPDRVSRWFGRQVQEEIPRLSPPEEAVASWLRGDNRKFTSLIHLLKHRHDRREELPLPSTEFETVILAASQKELADVINWLTVLYGSALPGNEEDEDG